MLSFDSSDEITYSTSALVWMVASLVTLWCTFEQHKAHRPAQRDILLLITASVWVRMLWFLFYVEYEDYLLFIVLNRVSLLFQCTAVLMLMFLWSSRMVADKSGFQKLKRICYCVYAVLALFIFVTSFLRGAIYAANLVVFGFVSFIVSFLSLCFGLGVQYQMAKSKNDVALISVDYSERLKYARRLVLVCSVLSLCFITRAIVFAMISFVNVAGFHPWLLYHVSDGCLHFPYLCIHFFILFVFVLPQVPELIPLVLILTQLSPPKGVIKRLGDKLSRNTIGSHDRSASIDIGPTSMVLDPSRLTGASEMQRITLQSINS